LKRSASWYQAGSNLRLAENRFLAAGEPNIATEGELAAPAANSASDDRNAEHAAVGEPRRRIDPARHAKAAARSGRPIVGDEKIWIRAFERDHLEGRVSLDLADKIVERVIDSVVDHIDRGVCPRSRASGPLSTCRQ
jgi:hypothetical protein